jgi:hypothetical protein
MTLVSAQSLAWLGVVAAVLIVGAAPVLIAVIRGAEPVGLVVMLTVLALGTGAGHLGTGADRGVRPAPLPSLRRGRRVKKGS